MTKYRCKSCRGTYESTQEGSEYYHQCPAQMNNPAWKNPEQLGITPQEKARRLKVPRRIGNPNRRDENRVVIGWKDDQEGREHMLSEGKITVVAGRTITSPKSEGLGREEI